MRTYVLNIVLALVAVNVFFRFDTGIVYNGFTAFGAFFVFYFLLWLLSALYDRNHFRKVPKIVNLTLFFFKELFMANLKVTWDVITPKFYMQPGVIAYPLVAASDLEITILANLISLTPGTLSLDVSEDRKILYFHAMYIQQGDIEAVISDIRNGFEKKLLEITR
jgi:multicomponent Na+:H+ antiporter subunit E